MEFILIIIGLLFLWSIYKIFSSRKVTTTLQNIVQEGVLYPRLFFINLSDDYFNELRYLDEQELKKIILGRIIEIALEKGCSMSSINYTLSKSGGLRLLVEYGAEEIAESLKNYFYN